MKGQHRKEYKCLVSSVYIDKLDKLYQTNLYDSINRTNETERDSSQENRKS